MALPGVKDFQAMYEEVFRDVHNTTDTSVNTFPDLTEVKKIINDEYRKFAFSKEWPFMRRERTTTLVDGTSVYTCATDVRKIGNVMREETLGMKVYFMPRQMFENRFPKGDVDAPSGRSNLWTPVDPDTDNAIKFKLRPIPNSETDTLVLKYTAWLRPVDMVADTDVMLVPADLQDIVLMKAKARCFRILDDNENEMRYLQEADRESKVAWREIMSQPGWVDETIDIFAEREGSGTADIRTALWFS